MNACINDHDAGGAVPTGAICHCGKPIIQSRSALGCIAGHRVEPQKPNPMSSMTKVFTGTDCPICKSPQYTVNGTIVCRGGHLGEAVAPTPPAVVRTAEGDEYLKAAHGDRAHAPFPPSSAEKWLNCPAWYKLTKELPDGGASVASAWGTVAHEKAEKCLRAHTRLDPNDEHACVVNPYVDYIYARMQGGGKRLLIETRVDVIGPHCWGSIDAIIIDEMMCEIEVIDLKGGKGHAVVVAENKQCGTYAIGALLKIDDNEKNWANWSITLTIIQPRVYDEPQSWSTTGAWLAELEKTEKKAIKAHLDPAKKPAPIAGDHCTFCKAQPTCPAHLAKAATIFPDMPLAVETQSPMAMPPEARHLTPEALASVLVHAPAILDWIKSVYAHALGTPPPGWKVVEGQSKRRWADSVKAIETLEMLGIDPCEKKLKGLGEIEALLGGGKQAKELIANIVVKPPGKPKLVSVDDPRPAVTSAEIFKDLDADAYGE